MAEEITIKIRAETEDAQQNVQDFREELDKTAKSSDKTSRSLGQMNKSWQKMGAGLKGRMMPRVGVPTTVQGPMGYGYGNMGGMGTGGMFGGRLGGMGKVGLIAGIGAIGGGLLGNLFGGGGGGKLAGFDKLNAVGGQSIIDFLDPHLKKITNELGKISGGVADAADAAAGVAGGVGNTSLGIFTTIAATAQALFGKVQDMVDAIAKTIGGWFNGLASKAAPVFDMIASAAEKIRAVCQSWFDGLYEAGERVFAHILNLAGQVLDVIKQWFNIDGGGTTPEPDVTPSPTPTPTPTPDDTGGGGGSSLWDKVKNAATTAISTVAAGIGSVVSKVTDALSSPSKAVKSITSVLDPNPAKATVSTTSDNAAVKVLTSMTNSMLNQGIGGSNIIGGVLGLGGGAAGAVSKGASLLSKIGSGLRSILPFAEGGVFMPNSPQLAILGDNRSEPEVAAPYSLIVQAVGDALRNNGGSTSTSVSAPTTIEVPISLNGKVIARGIYDDLENEKRRRNGSAMA